jgi:hypothetical protein
MDASTMLTILRWAGTARLSAALWAGLGLVARATVFAHEAGGEHAHDVVPAVTALRTLVEHKGPMKLKAAARSGAVTGEGYWRFEAVKELMPLPDEIRSRVAGAHGTLVVDAERDVVYWGLEEVGWVAFGEGLKRSWVVAGDPVFRKGNLHGADLWQRRGQAPLIAVADNVEGQVYLSDTSFARAEVLGLPPQGYPDGKGFNPTDVAFVGGNRVMITDGYGKAFFMPATVEPFAYVRTMHGGKAVSQTPHGITTDDGGRTLWVSARPEGQIKRWSLKNEEWLETLGLPAGSTVCDVDVWGDYALAPCLDGPERTPGPVYIVNLRKRAVVSVLRPKLDLAYTDAQHIHDAAWYVLERGPNKGIYVLFTNWNPGGVGVMRCVGVRD